jgi:sugar O-acyltransferase (sialic acid O-acetyltransferase NeuD family)
VEEFLNTNTNKIIIFGNKDMAELACFYFRNDSNYVPVAFCVDGAYLKESRFNDLPVIAFEDIEKEYPPDKFLFSAPIYASKMNKLKAEICDKIEKKGYNFASYISSKAYTWNAKIGKNAFIFEGCNIQPFCEVGDNLVIWSFSHIGHHTKVGNNNFISGNVVIAGHNRIDDFCFLGTNCSTKNDTHISSSTFVGQDASVVCDLEPEGGVWVGIPAKRVKESSEIKF